jgi:hypothetical protein
MGRIGHEVIIFIPFSCLGNMPDPTAALEHLSNDGAGARRYDHALLTRVVGRSHGVSGRALLLAPSDGCRVFLVGNGIDPLQSTKRRGRRAARTETNTRHAHFPARILVRSPTGTRDA